MDAFHSFWSVPNYSRNGGEIGFPDFELLTSILSALKWQQHSGKIKMITDSRGAEHFEKLGLANLWNEMDVSLDQIGSEVDPFLFWAAGKLYALKTMETPCVMLDTDLVIWKNVEAYLQQDVVTAHSEELDPGVYPDQRIFRFRTDYSFPEEWDFTLKAANTAFLYLRDGAFRDYYVDQAIRFFQHVDIEGLNPITAMCFAEQRVLPMCAAAKGQSLGYLMELHRANDQDFATHTWGFKQILRTVPEARHEFCMRCVKRILTDFPEREELLWGSEELRKYRKEYCEKKAR